MVAPINNMDKSTICAVSTAPGVGGIAVIRVSGPDAIGVVNSIWKGRDVTQFQTHTAHFGWVKDTDGQPLDQCVATIFRAPNSYTGLDTVELSVHGSVYVQQQLLQSLCQAGARMAEPGEFTRQAFANGKIDLMQAEAIADIIASQSQAANRQALAQMRGGVSRQIDTLRARLIDLAALLELELDFSEEEVEFASRTALINTANEVTEHLEQLAASYRFGNAIKNGVPTAIAGAANAGKSSLLNVLLHDDRAIVSSIPGTTRDIVEDTITVGPYTLRLMDTAGLRADTDTIDAIEAIGIQRTHSAIARAMIVIAVVDATQPQASNQAQDLLNTVTEANPQANILLILNKADLLYPQDLQQLLNTLSADKAVSGEVTVLPFSTVTGTSTQLTEALEKICRNNLPPAETAMLTNLRQKQAIDQALEHARATADALAANLPPDLVAQDLRATIASLSALTGNLPAETILQTIFSRFCIGK